MRSAPRPREPEKEVTMLYDFEALMTRAKRARRDELERLFGLAVAAISDQLQAQLRRGVYRLGAAAGAEGAQHRGKVRLDGPF